MNAATPNGALPLVLLALAAAAGCRAPQPESPASSLPSASSQEVSEKVSDEASEETVRAEGPGEIVLARVDGVPLTLEDAMATFEKQHGGHSVLMRGEMAVRDLTGRIIERQLFLAEALALKLDEHEVVQDAVEERRQMLAEQLFWVREVDEKVEVPEEDLEVAYARTEVALAVTLVETETREECEALRERVLAGESIAELAAGESIHPSRSSGGLLPFVMRGDLEPALDAALFELEEEGALTEVVATERGYAFARLDQRTVNENRPPREVMLPQIEKVLADRARKELREEVEQRVRDQAAIEVDEELTSLSVVLDEEREPLTVVTRSAGEELTLAELQGYLDLDALRAAPPDVAEEAVGAVLQEWIDRKAVRAAARELGLFEDPEIQPKIESWRKDILVAVLNAEYVYADVDPTDDEIFAYYQAHADEFMSPGQARVAYLVVATEAEAGDALARLEAGEDFGTLARELSTDQTANAHGGRIGWIREGEMIEAVEEPVFAAEPGAILGPIETELGVFVVHVMELRPAQPIPLDRAKLRARRGLEQEQRLAAYSVWIERLQERADVEIDEPGVERAVAWLEQEALRREAEEAAEKAAREAAQEAGEPASASPHGARAMPMPPPAGPQPEEPEKPEASAGAGQEEHP